MNVQTSIRNYFKETPTGETGDLLSHLFFNSQSQNPAPMGNMVNGKYRLQHRFHLKYHNPYRLYHLSSNRANFSID